MSLFNIRHPREGVSFSRAVEAGMGSQQGLFFPSELKRVGDLDNLLALPFVERSTRILDHLTQGEIELAALSKIVVDAFNFPVPLVKVSKQTYVLELFHGPTLAFKDFGARFLAGMLGYLRREQPTTILTATSGDTGAAVAHAFFKHPNVNVVILFPREGVSPLQRQLFATLGHNITAVAVDGDFDACQALAKRAFEESELAEQGLNSANSINIARLYAQVCYYFEAMARLPRQERSRVLFAVPSGNFGNLTAGLIAKAIGLADAEFLAATNVNQTVHQFLQTGLWQPQPTQKTISNAMDVSHPNNWSRITTLFERQNWPLSRLHSCSIDEQQTRLAMSSLHKLGYVADPHTAVAWSAVACDKRSSPWRDRVKVILGTAHPAKFKDVVDRQLGIDIELPVQLTACQDSKDQSIGIEASFDELKRLLLQAKSVADA